MLGLSIPTILSRILTLVIAFTFHEFAHAFVADRFGDTTPRSNGRLTLNPLAHLDILGSIMLLFAGFGWAKPVPVNPYAIQKRNSAGLMWVSLAGPLSNLLLAIVAALPFRFGWVAFDFSSSSNAIFPSLPNFLIDFIVINLSLLLFNFIPIAPLDGDKIAEYFFPPPLTSILERIRPFGGYILFALMIIPSQLGLDVFGFIMQEPLSNLLSLLLGV